MRAQIAVLVAVAVVGCGGGELTAAEGLRVSEARIAVSETILEHLDVRQDCEETLDEAYCDGQQAIDDMIAIYREKPDAKFDTDLDKDGGELTMRQVLEDAASDLDEYEPDLAAQIDRALGE